MKVIIILFNHLNKFVNLQMVVKVEEKFEKTRHVKNNDKSKKYTLRGERNVRYHHRILSNKKKSFIYNFT